jgi:hypothetical protein
VLVGKPALLRFLAGRRAQEIRQAGKVILGCELEHVGLLVGQHVLGKVSPERREPLHDLGHARLGGRV